MWTEENGILVKGDIPSIRRAWRAQGLLEVEPSTILDLIGSNQISLISSFPLELCYSLRVVVPCPFPYQLKT